MLSSLTLSATGRGLSPGPRTGSLGPLMLCCLPGEGDKMDYFGGHQEGPRSDVRKYFLPVKGLCGMFFPRHI
jgi:hypothetical protein